MDAVKFVREAEHKDQQYLPTASESCVRSKGEVGDRCEKYKACTARTAAILKELHYQAWSPARSKDY